MQAFVISAVLLCVGANARAASFWERLPIYEPDVCRARIETEGQGAKRLTGEIGPEDLAVLKGQRVHVVEAELKDGDYSGLDFRGFLFEDAVLSGRSLKGAKFTKAILDSSVFVRSDLSEADFSGAVLCAADFTEAKLGKARFDGVLLIGTDFSLAQAVAASFESARIYGGIFKAAVFDKAVLRDALLYCRRRASIFRARRPSDPPSRRSTYRRACFSSISMANLPMRRSKERPSSPK